jgi:hypothetical protein
MAACEAAECGWEACEVADSEAPLRVWEAEISVGSGRVESAVIGSPAPTSVDLEAAAACLDVASATVPQNSAAQADPV